MTQLSESTPSKQPRRKHSPAFKAKIVRLCEDSNRSVASIAREHNLNDNLIYNWRKKANASKSVISAQPAFIELPSQVIDPITRGESQTVHFEIACGSGTLKVEWPIDRIQDSVTWLKALLS